MLKKKQSKSKPVTSVTFEVPAEVGAERVFVVGDFNDWSMNKTELTKRKDGRFSATVQLAPGRYRFRYFLDGDRWENDKEADAYVPNEFGSEDCIVEV
jgi:1,4-alpha-glucan branching enzyme